MIKFRAHYYPRLIKTNKQFNNFELAYKIKLTWKNNVRYSSGIISRRVHTNNI